MSNLNFLHSGGNKVTLSAPDSNPESNITFKLPQADGSAGDLLKTDGSGALSFGTPFSNKNYIINGAMQIAQRGTSSTSNGFGSLDRWYNNLSGGSSTFSQETNSNPSETGGIQKYARLNVSSSSDYTGIRQRIEDVTSVPAGTVTLSFYAKGTAPAGGLYIYTTQDFGTGGSSDVDGTPVLITSSLTSSWVRYTAQISVGSVDGKTINAGSFFQLTISQGSNSSSTAYDLNITGVQVEAGDTATSFEHRSFGDELARCQRYYCKSYNYDVAPGTDTMVGSKWGRNYSADGRSANTCQVTFPVTMRITPNVTFRGIHSGTAGRWTSGAANPNASDTDIVVNSLYDLCQNGWTSMATADISSTQFFGGHFEADAEI